MPKTLSILGCTGSIGSNTLDVVSRFPDHFRVIGLAARSNLAVLKPQIEKFRPAFVALFDEAAAARLREELSPEGAPEVLSGMEGLIRIATLEGVEQVVSGMVGAVGLRPTFAAIEAGKEVALANKETLVLAGELMTAAARRSGSRILPMDSEHNAIFQCLAASGGGELERIILTASGGPFRDLPLEDFPAITRAQALNHPNWKMGPKITIDSATMMNKGLEVIEAKWLFDLPPSQIDVVIHRQSIIHSLVEFLDGSVLAQLGLPDMRTPIAYCLSYPDRLPLQLPRLNLAEVGQLDFEAPHPEKFPCLPLAMKALATGAGAPAALNGANEATVQAYLDGAFPFTEIAVILGKAMGHYAQTAAEPEAPDFMTSLATLEQAVQADQWGRSTAHSFFEKS